LTYGLAGFQTPPPQPPAATEEPGETGLPVLPTTGQCVLATIQDERVNVRRGPSRDYDPPVGSISPTGIYSVIGRNETSTWYLINYENDSGWVSAEVTRRGGDCRNLPLATYPPLNATLPAGTPTATPTLSGTPSATPTLGASPTPTLTPTLAAQVAPADNDYNLNVDMGNTQGAITQGTISNVVSYPNGDTEDRVFFSTNNINNQGGSGTAVRQIFNFTCSGAGSEFIEFFSGGQTFGCGDTYIIQAATADSDTGSIRIRAVGGSATYVQWTVLMQVERLN
jgi:uncharacterized protein YraI